MRVIVRFARWLVVLGVAFFVGAGVGDGLAGVFTDSEAAAGAAAWSGGLGSAYAAWRLLRSALRRRTDAQISRARAAGAQLRVTELSRYKRLLDEASETLAVTDPDRYVGERIGSSATAGGAGDSGD